MSLSDRSRIAPDPFAPESRGAAVEASPADSAEVSTKRRGWRRLLQVNLLMVLVALALVSGYFAMRRNFLVPYLEQKEAREELARRGAQFSAVPAHPKWAQALFQISDDDFQDVEMIKLEHSDGIRDADLVHLHKFPHLKRLYLASTQITDDGLKHLRYCTKLRRISLWDTHVGDRGIRELETLQDLRIIDIHRTWTTDAALETLGRLPALEELILDDATTKRGVAHLAGLKNLKRLSLRTTSLDADCLALLADCPLEVLELPSANFADRESAERFRYVPRIRSLVLSLPGATDEDLDWLGAMRNLRTLRLTDLQAEGGFARHVGAMRELRELTLTSDRFQKRFVEETLRAPRLAQATIVVPIVPTDVPRAPTDHVLRMPHLVSPWMTLLDSYPTVRGARGAKYGWVAEGFGTGAATHFQNRQALYMTEKALAPLLAQRGLKALELTGWEFAPGALASLAALDRLETVSLEFCRFAPDELEAFARLPNLRRILIRGSAVRDGQLLAFAETPRLESLNVHLTDASSATVCLLAKKESLERLVVYSTSLDDAFLDEVDAILDPRARAAVEPVQRGEAPQEPMPFFQFHSSGFTVDRAEAFRGRYQIAIAVAKEPNVAAPEKYWGAWPADEGTFGWIDPTHPQALELSPLDVDLPIVESARGTFGRPDGRKWNAAFARFAEAEVWNFFRYVGNLPARRFTWYDAPLPSPEMGWRVALTPSAGGDLRIALGSFDVPTLRKLLGSAYSKLALVEGRLPPECLEALSVSEASSVILGPGCEYDAALLDAISTMPRLATVQFGGCRKPSAGEVERLFPNRSLARVEFEHDGEPVYFEDIAAPASRRTPITLTGKVVYDAEDAIRERPPSLILANFDEKLWPAILAAPEKLTDIRPRDDWPNHRRLRLRLEVLQHERDKLSEVKANMAK